MTPMTSPKTRGRRFARMATRVFRRWERRRLGAEEGGLQAPTRKERGTGPSARYRRPSVDASRLQPALGRRTGRPGPPRRRRLPADRLRASRSNRRTGRFARGARADGDRTCGACWPGDACSCGSPLRSRGDSFGSAQPGAARTWIGSDFVGTWRPRLARAIAGSASARTHTPAPRADRRSPSARRR